MKLFKFIRRFLLVPYAALLLIHFVIKDRNEFFAGIFNFFPMPLLIGIGLLLSVLFLLDPKWLKGILGVIIFLLIHWFYSYYGFGSNDVSQENQHILFWNIDTTKFLPREDLKENIEIYDPELIVFIETRKLSLTELKYLKEQFPQYEFRILQGYMLVASKGNIGNVLFKRFESKSKCNILDVTINDKRSTIMLADISVVNGYRNSWQDLEPMLEFAITNEVDVIVGDFNTPYESLHFNAYKDHYTSFHDVSEGFAATWPKGLPLLELDQIWVNEEMEPIGLEKFFFKEYSNHDMLIGSFRFK